jgi:hypothetical protein
MAPGRTQVEVLLLQRDEPFECRDRDWHAVPARERLGLAPRAASRSAARSARATRARARAACGPARAPARAGRRAALPRPAASRRSKVRGSGGRGSARTAAGSPSACRGTAAVWPGVGAGAAPGRRPGCVPLPRERRVRSAMSCRPASLRSRGRPRTRRRCATRPARATTLSATCRPSVRSSATCSAIQRANAMRCDISATAASSRGVPTRSSTWRPGAA